MTYRQLDQEERFRIAALRSECLGIREIGRRIGRSASTVSREVRRNAYPTDGRYKAAHADRMARGRRRRSRKISRFGRREWRLVERCLRMDYSPEQASGFLESRGDLRISHETIYAHVWRDKARGGTLHAHLRCAGKRRRKRYGRYDSRGRLAGKRNIAARPEAVERRIERGHWESDTVMGSGKGCVLTLVERVSGYVLIGKAGGEDRLGYGGTGVPTDVEAAGRVPDDHFGQRMRVPRLQADRGQERGGVLLRESPSLLGARDEREHERADPAVSEEGDGS